MLGKSLLLALLAAAVPVSGYRYSLPGDALWPSNGKLKEFRRRLDGEMVLRGEPDYAVPVTYNDRSRSKPAAIVYPKNTRDVRRVVKFAKRHQVLVGVSSTGHHLDSRTVMDNTIHMDMSRYFTGKAFNEDAKQITVGTGQSLVDIIKWLGEEADQKYTIPHGAATGVGPYGYSTGGGHGPLARLIGLGADSIAKLRVVLANGRVVLATKDRNTRLFKALKGASGPSFGIVVSMTFDVSPVPEQVHYFQGIFPALPHIGATYTSFIKAAPIDKVSGVRINVNTPPQALGRVELINIQCFGKDVGCAELMAPLMTAMQPCVNGLCQIVPMTYFQYFETITAVDPLSNAFVYYTAVTSEDYDAAAEVLNNHATIQPLGGDFSSSYCVTVDALGGATVTADPDGELTSINKGFRNAVAMFSCTFSLLPGLTHEQQIAARDKVRAFNEAQIDPLASGGFVYWNEPKHHFPSEQAWQEAYWGPGVYNDLLRTKRRYDPTNFFTCYHCVGWALGDETFPSVCPTTTCSCNNNPTGACSSVGPV